MTVLTKRHRQIRLRWSRAHRDRTMDRRKKIARSYELRFFIHQANGLVRIRRFQANGCSLHVRQIIYRPVVCYCALGNVLLGVSGIRGIIRADLECYGVCKHHCGPVALLHGICLPNWKWNVPAGQISVSQRSNCVGVVLGT